MNLKKIIWLILSASLILSIGFVSATDVNDTIDNIVTQSSEIDLNDISEEDNQELLQNTQLSLQDENSRVIYVGQNKTTDGGNGTLENPFESLEIACNNTNAENKIEINIFEGTYYLSSDLKFNTSNLFIIGMGNVIIKPSSNDPVSLGLKSSTANFTFSNIIFDASNKPSFYVFKDNANLGIFNNCTFTNNVRISNMDFDKKFKYCNFVNTPKNMFFNYKFNRKNYTSMEFDYCKISTSYSLFSYEFKLDENNNGPKVIFNNVWFGINGIPSYTTVSSADFKGYWVNYKLTINKYAILSAYENYLGNNTYEIVGKLKWNDNTDDDIDKLGLMTVKFSSKTGDIPNSVILENGTFKVMYTSQSTNNEIDVLLDNEEITLEFKNNIQVFSNPICYGDNQDISIVLPQSTNSIINITVNNKTYNVKVNDSSSFNFTIPDRLLADNYTVDVIVCDQKNHLYGFNSTKLFIYKIQNNLNILTPIGVNIFDKDINITVLFEKEASGNITVFVGDKNLTKEINGDCISVDVSQLLSAGDNDITVVYSGNNKYLTQTKIDKLTVNGVNPTIQIIKPTNPKISDLEINITVILPNNSTGYIIISNMNKNISKKIFENTTMLNIYDLLNVGDNTILISYSGDNYWNSQIITESIFVSKLNPLINCNISRDAVKIGENFTIAVTLPEDATGQLIISLDRFNYNFNVTSKNMFINLSSNIFGIKELNVTYNGNDKYYPKSFISNILIERWDIYSNETRIKVFNQTVPLFNIDLPDDVSGNITIKINNENYNVVLSNGRGMLSIDNLLPNIYTAIIHYPGDFKYNPLNSNVSFFVPNPILKANDIVMLYKSGRRYSVYVTSCGSPLSEKNILFRINGKKINVLTNKEGYASIKIDLPPKSIKYKVTAEYQGVTVENYITIKGLIVAKNIKVKKLAKTLKIKVSLKKLNGKYLKGKKMTLKFKGKTFKSKTNKKGVATFKIKKSILNNLKKSKKYAYKVIYLKESVSKKIMVK